MVSDHHGLVYQRFGVTSDTGYLFLALRIEKPWRRFLEVSNPGEGSSRGTKARGSDIPPMQSQLINVDRQCVTSKCNNIV